ncbi:MAG: EfeM/EfeO family lipoprotein, partial [Actinomycetota bacterium]|nr:EfeM/EfeO family lipoprotein [Actinomycetota bacterium]
TELANLLARAEDLRDREAGGEKFTATQADQLGAAMQAQAEKIAGQVTQTARNIGVEIQEG